MGNEQKNSGPDPRIQAFLTILQQQPEEADCRLCQSQLHDYVVSQQAGEDYRAQFAWTAQHLDSCVACAEAYGLLFEAILAEFRGELPQPAAIPEPDLSFLTAVSDLPGLLIRAIRQTGQRLTIQFNQALIGLLAPPPQAASTRSTTDEGRYGRKLLELGPENIPEVALPLTLAAFADREQPDYCLVEVTVEPPGLSWPDLDGRLVTLAAGDKSWSAQTDEWGTAVFPDIPIIDLDALFLDVTLSSTS